MPRIHFKLTFISVLAFLFTFGGAAAEWSQDLFSPLPLCTAPNGQFSPSLIEDGQGRFISAWIDFRDDPGNANIYAQCFDADGVAQWNADGIQIVNSNQSPPTPPILVSDGQGGVFVVFVDAPGGYWYEVLAQHLNASGTPTWNNPINLVPNEEEISGRIYPSAVSDGNGGVIVCFEDYRDPYNPDIWAQRIDINGNLLWGDTGRAICVQATDQIRPVAVADAEGGAIFAWTDARNFGSSGLDLYMQHLNASGANLWVDNGQILCNSLTDQNYLVAESDGSGGALFAWSDIRTGNQDVYVARIEPVNGYYWWSGAGVRASDNAQEQFSPVIMSDGHGGAYVAWRDDRDDGWESIDIYAQHISTAGALLWSSGGYQAAGINSYQGAYGLELAPDGHDGVILAWNGTMGTGGYQTDLVGQRFNAQGSKYWDYNGQSLCQREGNQNYPKVLAHPEGGLVMVFQSDDGLTDSNIYASYIDEHGYPGEVAPAITSVQDFPADQGGVAIVSWAASYRDNPAQGINDYTVWKRLHQIGAKSTGPIDSAEYAHALTSGLPAWKVADLLLVGWTYVDAVDAAYQNEYGYDAPTYGDATDEQTIYTDYKIIARENAMVFWESDVEMGFSVDNLAPGAPLYLEAAAAGSDVALHWTPSGQDDEDLALYRLYRSASAGFVHGAGTFLATAADTTFVDLAPGNGTWYYLVTAQDVHDNEGDPSNQAMAGLVSGVGDGGIPTVFAVRGNYPNPFNPSTKIAFDLPQAGHVRLEVFDSSGRRVAVLRDEYLQAGHHLESWHGLDAFGRQVASGVYLARVSFGQEVVAHSMLLLK